MDVRRCLKSLEYEPKMPNFIVKKHLNGLMKLLEIYFLIPETLLHGSNIFKHQFKAILLKSLEYEAKMPNFIVK